MQRPTGITVTTFLMALNICVGIVFLIIHPLAAPANFYPAGRYTATQVMFCFRLLLFAFTALQCVTVWFYWLGKFWARRLVIAGCLLYLWQLVQLRATWNHSHAGAVYTAYDAILACFLLWYLFTPEAKAWFPWPAAATRYRPQPIDR